MAIQPSPIRGEAVVRAAQESIKQYIIDNQLGTGAPLPTEHALSRTLGISRNSLREALRALETIGVIETRHGLGTFVGAASLAPLIDGVTFNLAQRLGTDTRALGELLELREIMEVTLIQRVTDRLHHPKQQHTLDQLAYLELLVCQMEQNAAEGVLDPTTDRLFHVALYAPLNNRALTLLLQAFWEVQDKVRSQLPELPGIQAQNAAWHRAILTAVQAGDPMAAAAAMRQQFSGIEQRMALLDDAPALAAE